MEITYAHMCMFKYNPQAVWTAFPDAKVQITMCMNSADGTMTTLRSTFTG